MKKVAISIGDLNGIGIELALHCHSEVCTFVEPTYCIDDVMLQKASKLLGLEVPHNFQTISPQAQSFEIEAGKVSKKSGAYSFASFEQAITLAKEGKCDALCTLPIHKKAWEEAGISYKGHTDALRDFFKRDAIMMLGSPKMYVALFSEHIPLKEVPNALTKEALTKFLVDFYNNIKPTSTVALLGLNPHAGDDGVLGDEEKTIQVAREEAHTILGVEVYTEPLVPDIAFTPKMREKFTYYVAMYHDQGLAPLKALYFDEGINVSLNLPILRTSVDHGTAFDIAYKKKRNLNTLSYLNALKYIASA